MNVTMTADLNNVYTIQQFEQKVDYDKLFLLRREYNM